MTFHDDDPLADERDAAMDAFEQTIGADVDRPSWREAKQDADALAKAIEQDLRSGVRRGGWEISRSALAARQTIDEAA